VFLAAAAVSVCAWGGVFCEFLCCLGTCPLFHLLNIMMRESPLFLRKKWHCNIIRAGEERSNTSSAFFI
jgi:hypothetical protein